MRAWKASRHPAKRHARPATPAPAAPQNAAEHGALRSPAARFLNAGTLLCALVHVAVEAPMLLRERGACKHLQALASGCC